MFDKKPPTHTAYAIKRDHRSQVEFLEIGIARIERDENQAHYVHINRLPTVGFTWQIHLAPIGVKPALPEAEPQRPDRSVTDEFAGASRRDM